MRKLLIIIIYIFFLQNVYAEENQKFDNSYLKEIVLPGYNFYRKEEIGWGNFFLIMRLASLYGIYYYHQQFITYKSLYRASQIADFYFGPGLSYRDPIGGGYKTSKEFYIYTGRSSAFRNISLGIHLLLLGIGIYKGYRDSWEEYINSSPEVYNPYNGKNITFYFKQKDIENSIYYTIHLDF